MNEWTKKMCFIYIYIHTMEYYVAIKNNEILPFATTWMDLESIMLSERNQRRILYVITYMWKKPTNLCN